MCCKKYLKGDGGVKKQVYRAGLVAMLCVANPLMAQLPGGAPEAGESLRELESERLELPKQETPVLESLPQPHQPESAADVLIPVQQFRLQGNQLFDSPTLLALVEDLQQRELTLAELYGAVDRITAFYRERGYLLTQAYLPEQQVGEDGAVIIGVLEGRYGTVSLDNQSRVKGRIPLAIVSGLEFGDVVELTPLERRVLLLNDLPGVRASSSLSAGAEVGESDLTVRLDNEPRVTGAVTLDNHGNRHTGEYRLGTRLQVASPFGFGDALSLNLLASDEKQLYYQARYDMPVTGWGTRAGVSASKMDYELAGDFKALEAVGTATTMGLFVTHPWVRSRNLNLNSYFQADRKDLEDELLGGLVVTEKTANNITLGLSGDWRDGLGGGGVNAFSVSWVQGHLRGDADSDGSFGKLQASVLRLQRLSQRFSLYTALQGQATDGNLDSSEKFSLGGAYGVRAYPVGEASADEAVMATVEMRYQWRPEWQFKLFADGGYARLIRQPDPDQPGRNHRNLSGVGVGGEWRPASDWLFSAVVAQRAGEQPLSDRDRSARVWVQGQWLF